MDNVTLTAVQFFWVMFGMMVLAAGITWVVMWGYYRQQSNAAIDAAHRELEARTADLPGMRMLSNDDGWKG